MFDLEFRPVAAFGLVGVLATWLLVWTMVVLVRGAMLRSAEETDAVSEAERRAFKKFKRVWGTLLWPVMGLIVLGWLILVLWGGWRDQTMSPDMLNTAVIRSSVDKLREGPRQSNMTHGPGESPPAPFRWRLETCKRHS